MYAHGSLLAPGPGLPYHTESGREPTSAIKDNYMHQSTMNRKFSVIIPAYNEGETITATLAHVQAVAPHGTQIVLADGHPRRTTLKAVSGDCARNVHLLPSPKGRAVQMNTGAEVADGDVLLFLHVDTRLPAEAFTVVDQALDAGAPAGAFDLELDAPGPVFALISRMASLRSRITRIPYGDQALFFRREVFQALGGYPHLPLMEDVEIMLRLKRRGLRPAISRRSVRTSARRWQTEGIWRCTLRNWTLISLYYLGVPAHRLARYYQ